MRNFWNHIKNDPWILFVPVMGIMLFSVMIIQAAGQDLKNDEDREELAELRIEVEELRTENWNLKDTNWSLAGALNSAGAEINDLKNKLEEEGK